MALTDAATILPGVGHLFHGVVGSPAPDFDTITPSAPTAPWSNMGHTSRENNAAITKEGGETSVIGSWQTASLRTSSTPITYGLTVSALQLDNTIAAWYFGGGDATQPGYFGIPKTSAPAEIALALLLIDGSRRAGLWLPRVSVIGGDGPEFNPEGLLEFQLVINILDHAGTPDLGRWYGEELGTGV